MGVYVTCTNVYETALAWQTRFNAAVRERCRKASLLPQQLCMLAGTDTERGTVSSVGAHSTLRFLDF